MGFALSEMTLSSPAFEHRGEIPSRHTQEGENVSPPLQWSNPPDGTRSFAILCHDPDAPVVAPDGTYGFVHWVLYNIPADVMSLPQGASNLYTTGPNQQGENAYGGPMPPDGHGHHHYFFALLALSQPPELEDGLSMCEFLERVEPSVLAMNRLVGVYERPAKPSE